MLPIRRWLANPASLLLALRLSEMHWNGGDDLLPDRVLSIGLTDQSGYVVFFNKLTQSAIVASCRLAATAKIRASLSEILNTLAVSLCKGPILAIANDRDRKLLMPSLPLLRWRLIGQINCCKFQAAD